MTAIATKHPGGDVASYALSTQDVTAQMGVHADDGLTAAVSVEYWGNGHTSKTAVMLGTQP